MTLARLVPAVALACALLLSPPAAGADLRVVAIEVEGLSRVDRANIDRVLPFKVGDSFTRERAAAAVRAVFRLGAFSRVEVLETPSGAGVAVMVRVSEYPLIRGVAIEGNSSVSTEELKKVLTLKAYGFFDTADFPSQVGALKKAYEAKGFTEAIVTPRAEPGPAGVRVVFAVEEGKKSLIAEIDILGNRALDDAAVKGAMASGEEGPLSWISDSGVLEKEKLSLDLERIRLLYWDHGYLDVRVEEPVIRRDAEGRGIYVGIRVEEGEQLRAGKVDLAGEWPSPEEARALLTLAPGDVVGRGKLVADIKALEDSVKNRGYARARVTPQTKAGAEKGTAEVVLSLARGPLVRVRRIDITGNHKTRDYVIRQEMRLGEGELYHQGRIEESTRFIRALGYFNSVEIKSVPVAGDEGTADLSVQVVEGSSGSVSAGLGYSSQEGLTGTLQYSQRNLFGRGQRLNLSVEKGGKSTNYNIGLTEPRVFMSDYSLGVDLWDTLKEYSNYKEARKGGGVRTGYRFSDLASVSLGYRYSWNNVSDVDPAASEIIQEMAGETTTSSVRAGFSLDTRDYPLDPRTGYTVEISQEVAGGALGGSNEFLRTQLEGTVFTPLAGDLIGSAHLLVGVVNPFGGGALPVTERFFVGGMGTLRGFGYRMVGPLDEDGEAIGGNKQVIVNIEATYPLVEEPRIKGVLFLDIGNLWGDGQELDLGDLRAGAGIGFRWYSPMGLLRLEWGVNLSPRPGEVQPGWEFTIGTSF